MRNLRMAKQQQQEQQQQQQDEEEFQHSNNDYIIPEWDCIITYKF